MSEWYLYFAFFLNGAALMEMVMALGVTVLMPDIDRWSRHFFISIFSVFLLYAVVCLVDALSLDRPGMTISTMMVIYLIESSLVSLLMPMLTVYLLHCCGESIRGNSHFRIVLVLWCLFFLLLCSSFFTDWFYTVTPQKTLIRTPWYPLSLLSPLAILLLNVVDVIHWRSRLSRRQYYAFLVGLVPMTFALLVYMFVDDYFFFALSLFIFGFSMFDMILFDQINRSVLLQREIAHQRASIQVLEMRPHFIYNTMMSIYYLCDQAPQKAKQVTMDFTTYLRKNFTAIVSAEPIPFSDELEHTRAYLAVEQAQFEDRLFVNYDTAFTQFRVPPLTLQPIVENAVKHGMDPDGEPLHITIQSRETDDGFEITVEDDGPGFGTVGENEPHIALKNIQQRLSMMCGGKMTILPRDGGGTVVKILIDQVS